MGWLFLIAIGFIGAILLLEAARRSRAGQQATRVNPRPRTIREHNVGLPRISIEVVGTSADRYGDR